MNSIILLFVFLCITAEMHLSAADSLNTVQKTPVPEMRLICSNTFTAGDILGEGNQNKILRSFALSAYYLGVTEITVAEFSAFTSAENYVTEAEKRGKAFIYSENRWHETPAASWRNPGYFYSASHPVTCISFTDAAAYCNWLSKICGFEPCYDKNFRCDFSKNGFRLPTEAEWESAASGGFKNQKYRYPWGNNNASPAHCNYSESLLKRPMKVKSYYNNQGFYDMSGNVWEWCNDWYADNYSACSPAHNPQGPESGTQRVLRGGSFHDCAANVRSALRYREIPEYCGSNVGFRIARNAEETKKPCVSTGSL